MAQVREDRWRTHLEIEQVRRSLGERIDRIEAAAAASATRPGGTGLRARAAGLVKWMGPALPQLVTSAVMLVLAFWIKDSVDLAIRQQQLQLSYIEKMKTELVEMAREGAPIGTVERSAMMVAAFGKPAIMPLVNELRAGGNRAIGAEAGLRSLAFTDAEPLCDILLRALQAPTRLFAAEGLMAAVRTLGAAGCASALPTLRRQLQTAQAARKGAQIDAAEALKLVSEPPTVPQLKELITVLEQNVGAIEARPRTLWRRS